MNIKKTNKKIYDVRVPGPHCTVLYCTVLYCTVLYVYPDLTTLLWDTFTRGVMVGAVPGTVADMDWTGVVPRVTIITRSRNLSGC